MVSYTYCSYEENTETVGFEVNSSFLEVSLFQALNNYIQSSGKRLSLTLQ